jgi:acyl-CoA synthetase (AMP-forming)/AMP-acid ligase II
MPRKWDAERAVQLIETESVTQFTGVVAMAGPFLDVCEAAGTQLPTLTAVMFGASSVPPDLVARFARVFAGRIPMGTGYGMTETTSSFARISGQEYLDHPDSVGRPFPVYDVKIVDEHGEEMATGTAGELWVRGPSVVPGYWRNPEATAAAFTNGWHHTGDIARLDDTGRIYPVDRKKDIIIRGGENVYCVEVEAVIHAHPDVAAVAVVGRPDPDLGEEVVAVVRRRPGAGVTAEQLREHAAARLAYFKVPTAFVFADRDFPRTATGKILKRQLADEVRTARKQASQHGG